jgi:hypothetical protein
MEKIFRKRTQNLGGAEYGTTNLSQFELDTFSDHSEREEIIRMKEIASNSGGHDYTTGLEKILRSHRFNKGESLRQGTLEEK